MHAAAVLLVLVASPAASAARSQSGLVKALERDEAESLKTRPVQKVVNMLKDMLAELNAEMEDDKAVYEMLTCWCETNRKEKTKAIEEGEAKIAQLEADLGEYAAKIKELKALIAESKDKYNGDWEALNKASAMRMKDNKEFHGEETDLIQAIKACEQAIVVLGEHHPELAQVRAAARGLKGMKLELISQLLKGEQFTAVKAFMQESENSNSFLSETIPGMQSYAPQSGQILGILKQLKEDMEGDLKDARGVEAKSKSEFDGLKAAQEEEMAAAKKQLDQAEQELAEIGEKHAVAMEELADTEEQLAKDKTFLENLEKRCAEEDKEYEMRMKGRMEEIMAVTDTIKFLNSDEAFEMFDKTVNTAFLEKGAWSNAVQLKQHEQALRAQAVAVLTKLAGHEMSPQLALAMTSVKLDAFTKVKELIDKMVAELKQQQADEIAQRDWCIAELDKTNLTMEAKYDLQANLMAKIEDLNTTIATLTKDIEMKTDEIAEMQTQMKRASEDREGSNADYQQTVMDQRITQTILQKALDRMKMVYALLQQRARLHRQPGAPHIQTSATDTDPGNGPARFTKYEKNAGGKKVVAMIEGVIADSKKLEAEAIAAEQDSQTAYENFMKESNDSITSLTEAISNMNAAKAAAEEALSMAKTDLDQTNKELSDLHDTETDLHNSCDYLLKNFFVRQEARAAEINALGEAKAILSGAK